MMNRIKALGSGFFSILAFILIISTPIFAFIIAAKYGFNIETFLTALSGFAIVISITILLPLAIFKRTRLFAGVVLYLFSYIFGATTWVLGFIVTLSFWGFWGVFIGLLLAGIGVVPLGMIASAINGQWGVFWILSANLVFVIATRAIAISLIEHSEGGQEVEDEVVLLGDSSRSEGLTQYFPILRWGFKLKEIRLNKLLPEFLYFVIVGISYLYWPYLYGNILSIEALFLWAIIVGLLIAITQKNYWSMLIPDSMLLVLLPVIVAYLVVASLITGSYNAIVGGLAAALINGVLLFLLSAYSKGHAVGGGDIKLGALAGLLLGLPLGPIALFVFFTFALVIRLAGKFLGPNVNVGSMPSGGVWTLAIVTTMIFSFITT